MKKNYLLGALTGTRKLSFLLCIWLGLSYTKAGAQGPALPVKASLSQSLLSGKTFSNGTAVDTVIKPYAGTSEYTLEVLAKINGAVGRGLDIEGRNGALNGFRLSLDTVNLKNTNSLASPVSLTSSSSAQQHTIRIAVKNDSAHIYQNGTYIQSQPVTTIKDIVNGVETDALSSATSGTNLMPGWAGTTGNFTGMPSAYSWGYNGTTSTTLFAAANATTTGTSRFLDVNTASNAHTYNGTAYTGRLFYVRWDAPSIQNTVYYYPVTLEANTTYDFSMLHAYVNNATGNKSITVGIGTTNLATDRYASHVFWTSGTVALKRESFVFTSQAAGTYYLTFTGDYGLFSIGELSLNKNLPGSFIPNWAGIAPNTTGTYSTPGSYGWAYSPSTVTGVFNTANATSNVRLMDSSSSNQNTYSGSTGTYYSGRVLYIRWDNSSWSSLVYRYPVVLAANTTYDFSMLHAYLSNATGSKTITVGIGKDSTTASRIASHVFTTTGTRVLKKEDFVFNSQDSGLYYITINGDWALYAIAELSLKKVYFQPRFIFGKDYLTGAVDMQIISATYDSGAYAPAAVITNPRQTVTLTGSSVKIPTSFNTDFIVPGKTDVHFTAENTPYSNSSIALNSNDSWLFFDNVLPSNVIANWLPTVTVNGAVAVNNSNVRVAVYKNGTAVIPNGNLTSNAALTVFTQPSLAGSSQSYPIQTIFNSLGAFDNSIRSFQLKRGYMATFANNANGSGYSRVFIANDSDLTVNSMPAGLDTSISFIRVMKWNWPSKKGKAGWDPNKITATWYYDWNIAGDASSPNYDYEGIRQNNGWPSYTDIINKGVNHISGFNEPDDASQSNLTVDQAYNAWSGMYSTGLRVGSPAPANPESSWITQFLAKCDSFNNRVDYVAIHCYWGGQTPAQWYSRLLAIYNRVKRPLWITEWNNGANWTTETWPTDTASQFQKQLSDMKGILQVLDTSSFVERYAEYDWVQNKRALVLADTLTPAGKYYAADKSDFAYNPAKAYVTAWKLVSPRLYSAIPDSNYYYAKISWTDLNGETGSKYTLERKINGRDSGFIPVQDFTGYANGGAMSFMDSVYGKATYRLKAIGVDTTNTTYSGSLDVVVDLAPVAPTSLVDTVLSSSQAKLNWNTGTNARSYNLKRSLSGSGPWTNVAARTTAFSYLDTTLAANTTYYYVVTSLNSAGESANSTVLSFTTPALATPAAVLNPHIASGDQMVTLTWNFQYDVQYKILRSFSAAGVYDTIASVNGLRYTDSNKINSTFYYYKIVSYNAAGTGPVSDVLVAKPVLGQLLHVGFNEAGGTTLYDDWGGYNGTMYNSPQWVAGKDSAAGAVNLVKTSSSYIQLGDGVISSLNDFTIATWFKMPANQGTNTRLFDFGTSTTNYMILVPRVSANNVYNLRYKIINASGTNDRYIPYELPLNTWVHIVISQQGTTFKLYVNGVLQYTDNNSTLKPSDLGITNQNYLGRSQWSTDPYTDHTYDDFSIYNYALSDGSVASLYQGTTILPITLVSFAGNATAHGNLLNWKISTTSSQISMELEKSTDAKTFGGFYSTTANGRNGLEQSFSYIDTYVNGNISYYRLKMIDIDGKLTYSPVVSIVNAATAKDFEITGVYPNPVRTTAYLGINSSKAIDVTLMVRDNLGRTVQVSNKSILSGSNLLNLDASLLNAGMYTINVYHGDAMLGSLRFAVSR